MFRNRFLGAVSVLACLGTATAAADVIVSFSPLTDTTTVGGSVAYEIRADLTNPILGWGLDLSLSNPAVASVTGVAVGGSWTAASGDGDGLGGLAFPSGISGANILLATVTLEGDAIGSTDLLLSVTPGDQTEGFALDPIGFDGNVTLGSGELNVVPEPASLMLIGLGALALRRRA